MISYVCCRPSISHFFAHRTSVRLWFAEMNFGLIGEKCKGRRYMDLLELFSGESMQTVCRPMIAAIEKSVAPLTTNASLHCVSGNIFRFRLLIFASIFFTLVQLEIFFLLFLVLFFLFFSRDFSLSPSNWSLHWVIAQLRNVFFFRRKFFSGKRFSPQKKNKNFKKYSPTRTTSVFFRCFYSINQIFFVSSTAWSIVVNFFFFCFFFILISTSHSIRDSHFIDKTRREQKSRARTSREKKETKKIQCRWMVVLQQCASRRKDCYQMWMEKIKLFFDALPLTQTHTV